MAARRIRLAQVTLQSYHPKFITDAVADIRRSAAQMGISIGGTVPLPTKTRRLTVRKATFVYKKAQASYQHDTHKRLIEFYGHAAPGQAASTGQAATNVVHFLRYLEHTILQLHPGCSSRVTLFSDERVKAP